MTQNYNFSFFSFFSFFKIKFAIILWLLCWIKCSIQFCEFLPKIKNFHLLQNFWPFIQNDDLNLKFFCLKYDLFFTFNLKSYLNDFLYHARSLTRIDFCNKTWIFYKPTKWFLYNQNHFKLSSQFSFLNLKRCLFLQVKIVIRSWFLHQNPNISPNLWLASRNYFCFGTKSQLFSILVESTFFYQNTNDFFWLKYYFFMSFVQNFYISVEMTFFFFLQNHDFFHSLLNQEISWSDQNWFLDFFHKIPD